MEPSGSEHKEPMRCYHCDGFLWPDTTLDLHTGVSIHELVCLNCGRRWYPGYRPRVVTAPPARTHSASRRPSRRLCEKDVDPMGPDLSHVTSSIKVLFIDPNEEERQKWADRLTTRSAEYIVLQAAAGRSGLKLINSERVDCVVLELDLPERNGLSVLLDLVGYAYNPRMAVVVLTNYPLDALCPLAIQNGAQSCLRKDQISVQALDMAIRKAIAVVGPRKKRAA